MKVWETLQDHEANCQQCESKLIPSVQSEPRQPLAQRHWLKRTQIPPFEHTGEHIAAIKKNLGTGNTVEEPNLTTWWSYHCSLVQDTLSDRYMYLEQNTLHYSGTAFHRPVDKCTHYPYEAHSLLYNHISTIRQYWHIVVHNFHWILRCTHLCLLKEVSELHSFETLMLGWNDMNSRIEHTNTLLSVFVNVKSFCTGTNDVRGQIITTNLIATPVQIITSR